MKPIIRKIRFYLGILFLLILVCAVFFIGWSMSFTSIDLNKVKEVSGIIKSRNLQQTGGSRAIPGQRDLIIHLQNEAPGFWIYRSSQNYDDLLSRINPGTQIKIFHGNQLGSNGYYAVYQAEAPNEIIYPKDEYERKENLAGRFIVLPGAFILLGVIFLQKKKDAKHRFIYCLQINLAQHARGLHE